MRRAKTWPLLALLLVTVLALAAAGMPARSMGSPEGVSHTVYLAIVRKHYPPYPDVPSLAPIDNADGDGNYTLTWGAAERAENYELQEQWEGGEWFTAYYGADTWVDLANRPAGIYWYRCRAENSWGQSAWSNAQGTAVGGDRPGTISTPSSSRVEAGGKALVKVTNDCPYVLHIEFTGPQPQVMELPKCAGCSVYSFMGPIFCPTSGRPIQETQLEPGPYRVFVTVSDPSVRPYIGHWQLQGDRRYSVCFFIVRSYGAPERTLMPQLVAAGCQ